MASMRKVVIMMLFTGEYCYAHTAEKQDTSTKIAGNNNIRNDENPEGGKHPIKGGQIGDETLNMREEKYPRWTPPTSGFDILNRNRPPTMVRPDLTTTQTARKQVRIKEEPEVSIPKREPKCSFCREETHSYQTCPVLRQMILKQANELTHRRVAEYEKSQEEAIRHTI